MKTMSLACWVAAAGLLSACTTAGNQSRSNPPMTAPTALPPSQPMDPSYALGLWRSSFGAVKIEPDATRPAGGVMGVWIYQRDGREVVGFFSGNLRGNVLDFTWHDPAVPRDLVGSGYVVFDPTGVSFAGRLWTEDGARQFEWNGQRARSAPAVANPGHDSRGGQLPLSRPPAPATPAPDASPSPYGAPRQDQTVPDRTSEPPPRDTSVPGNPYGN
ncbi:MAG: hypothetical protein MJE77_08130 [Proteobacteria bacterium]|nr:hypothetical protein [Pseudomonadota bacterium]